jgi:regulator of cell morphogenesis and NO signaling
MSNELLTALDVRPVEPKHRFETIMSSYDALPRGGTLHLIVDHDPECMYYTLEATRGAESFTFEYLENGPEVWRVDVHKR